MEQNNFKALTKVFEASCEAKDIFAIADKTVRDNNMLPLIMKGVIVGFSGGADSVMLLLYLQHLKEQYGFPLAAMHINHGIRGEEALRDELFAENFSKSLDIPFFSRRIDIPAISVLKKQGIEETARNERYSAFNHFLAEHIEYSVISTAHNATDNLETIIFNMMRGSGTGGLKGILPIRKNIIRPLIEVPKQKILDAFSVHSIPYVYDSTNSSTEYKRNYIRHEILPRLTELSPSPEASAIRLCASIREDDSFIEKFALNFYKRAARQGEVSLKELSELDSSPLSRVVKLMIKERTDIAPEAVHINAIKALIKRGGDFCIDIPRNSSFISKDGICFVCERVKNEKIKSNDFSKMLSLGFNEIPELGIAILVSRSQSEVSSSKVYNFSIQAKFNSAIIDKDLFVRTRNEGDSYVFGGMTRKLKKLFVDKKIPKKKRESTAIICDNEGILWVEGFPPRDGSYTSPSEAIWISIYKKAPDGAK